MKKGALNLSINAILLLVLAMALMGMGIAFMKGLFKQMEEKVGVAVSHERLTNPPTNDNPITTAPATLSLMLGESGFVTVAFMNIFNGEVSCNMDVLEGGVPPICDSGETCSIPVFYSDADLTMAEAQINTWQVGFNLDSVASSTYLFTAKLYCSNGPVSPTIEGTYTKDIVVYRKRATY